MAQSFYDIFNGDADGICALHQLRLAEPRDSVLVTGVKRDIALVGRIAAEEGDELTVLDVSMSENVDALERCLAAGARCLYFDHHHASRVPEHPGLRAFIDPAPDLCTSLLVDRYLGGQYRAWAVVAAFGDGLPESARRSAEPLGLELHAVEQLRELGEALNYNAYGDTTDDLFYHPADLFRAIALYRDPFAFISSEPVFDVLRAGYGDDMLRADEVRPEWEGESGAILVLPGEPWARRVSGVFANRVAQANPGRAHAILTRRAGGFVVSVRAPRERPTGAAALCRRFPTGGGREAAAGINDLPESRFADFEQAFRAAFG